MRLDRLVVEHFKADGPHWQTRVNDTLLKIVEKSIASTRRGVKVNVQRPIPASQRSKVGAKTGALGRRLRAKGKPVAKPRVAATYSSSWRLVAVGGQLRLAVP